MLWCAVLQRGSASVLKVHMLIAIVSISHLQGLQDTAIREAGETLPEVRSASTTHSIDTGEPSDRDVNHADP